MKIIIKKRSFTVSTVSLHYNIWMSVVVGEGISFLYKQSATNRHVR